MAGREHTIGRVRSLLERAGFFVTDTHGIRPTSFDLVARRDALLLLVKVLKNIDALAPEEAGRITELATLLGASPLIVGEASGSTQLAPGVVYNRYGLPIVVELSLEEYLLHGVPPFLFSSPGGIFARVDGVRLRSLREARGLSLGALASVAGVSRRTIQLYEEGAGAEIEVIERLETYLSDTIARPIALFPESGMARAPEAGGDGNGEEPGATARAANRPRRTGDPLRDTVFRELDGMGWEVVVTVRCPFDAFTHGDTGGSEEVLLTSVGSLRSAQHRADVLHRLARVIEAHSLWVIEESDRRTSIDGLPIVSMRELKRHRDRAELLELIEEREGS
jgi:putative transcriptional regulator